MPLQIICIIPFMRLGELLLGAEKLGADHITLKASCYTLLENDDCLGHGSYSSGWASRPGCRTSSMQVVPPLCMLAQCWLFLGSHPMATHGSCGHAWPRP